MVASKYHVFYFCPGIMIFLEDFLKYYTSKSRVGERKCNRSFLHKKLGFPKIFWENKLGTTILDKPMQKLVQKLPQLILLLLDRLSCGFVWPVFSRLTVGCSFGGFYVSKRKVENGKGRKQKRLEENIHHQITQVLKAR